MDVDVLFLNSVVDDSHENFGDDAWMLSQPPSGLLGILDTLDKHGFVVKGVDEGIARHFDPQFDIQHWASHTGVNLFTMTSLWNYLHSWNRLSTMKALKKAFPDKPLVVGGLHTSLFWRDVIDLPEVDIVVRGEGERPLLMLAQQLRTGRRDFRQIPNLVYKDDAGVHVTEHEPQWLSADELDGTDYLRFDLFEGFVEHSLEVVPEWFHFPVKAANGCPYVCPRCWSHARGDGRNYYTRAKTGMLCRGASRLKEDITRATEMGFDRIALATSGPFSDAAYRDEFINTVVFPEVALFYMLNYESQFEYAARVARNFHPERSHLYIEQGGCRPSFDRLGIPTDDRHLGLLSEFKGVKSFVLELYSTYVSADDLSNAFDFIERYRDEPRVRFVTNVSGARPWGHLDFWQLAEISRYKSWSRFLDDGQKAVLQRFRDHIVQRGLEQMIGGWDWESEFGAP